MNLPDRPLPSAPDAGTAADRDAAIGIEPFDTRLLPVGDGHTLHIEQVGRPDGIPAVFLHGGPGGGCQPSHRTLFDPGRFRTVLFDQRGAGRSTPKRSLVANTTAHLIDDLERIRAALGIERWMVVGGSWGALLAVAYAQAHRSRVTALALRSVFLGRAEEVDRAFLHNPRIFHPALWQAFVDLLPAAERDDPLGAYGRRLMDPAPAVHRPAAFVWHDYERALSTLTPALPSFPPSLDASPDEARPLPNSPFVEWHYFRHHCFLQPDELLLGAGRLAGIPGIIVQGRYDLLCPPTTAAALSAGWPGCELRVIEAAGHSLAEPGIRQGLVSAISELAERRS